MIHCGAPEKLQLTFTSSPKDLHIINWKGSKDLEEKGTMTSSVMVSGPTVCGLLATVTVELVVLLFVSGHLAGFGLPLHLLPAAG